MKRFIALFLFIVNLQVVINNDQLSINIFTQAFAQHMTKEADDNCYDDEIGWYHSPFDDCSDVEVSAYKCSYCGEGFQDASARDWHQQNCPSKSNENYTCPYCGQQFSSSSERDSHENSCPNKPDSNNNSGNIGGGSTGGLPGGSVGSSGTGTPVIDWWNTGNRGINMNFCYTPLQDETIIKGYKIVGKWRSQLPNPYTCFLCCMEYIWNIQHLTPDYMNGVYFNELKNYLMMRDIYNLEYLSLYGYEPASGKGVNITNECNFLTQEGFINFEISSNDINSYIDSQYFIIYTYETSDENDNKSGHAAVVIGYDKQSNLTLIDPWEGEITKRPVGPKGKCYAIAISPYTSNSKSNKNFNYE
jgi:hypothetical protein